ncbi:fatty acid--CoA ligase family protein [Coraliomargarita algicola]
MNWIRNKLAAYTDRIACHEGGRAYSYADFLELIDQAAAKLPSGNRQVVEVQTPTTIEGLATLLAIAERGHIALPLPLELPAAEQAKMRQVAAASPLYDQLQGSGLILFSSGTSGEPKGMLHNFDALLQRYQNIHPRQDRSLLLLLIDHIGGLDSAFRCLFAGSTLVVPTARTPEAAGAAIATHQVNVLPASPTFLNLMLLNGVAASHDLSSVEIIAYGAEAMPQTVLTRLGEAFPNAQLQQKFGTSETGAIRIKSADNGSLFFRIQDSETQWKVVADELWLKTPSRILGYLNASNDSLEADGWYRTGDLVETDDKGYLRILGRASALINVGGQKVHPAEVEAVLNTVPGITASKVFAKPAPITGNAVACEIVVNKEQDLRAWKRAIRNHCRGQLAPWKIPSSIAVVDTFAVNRRMKQQ